VVPFLFTYTLYDILRYSAVGSTGPLFGFLKSLPFPSSDPFFPTASPLLAPSLWASLHLVASRAPGKR